MTTFDKKKYAPILHLLPKRTSTGRPSKAEVAERVRMAEKLLSNHLTGVTVSSPVREVIVVPPVERTDEEILAAIHKRFNVLNRFADGMVRGAIHGLVVTGPPGVGKTELVSRKFEAAKEANLISKFQHVKGVVTPINLYKLLWKNRETNNLLLLDDADKVFNFEDSLNILKAALDTSASRKVTWASEAATLRSEDIPNNFEYRGGIAFISNRNFRNEIDAERSKSEHLDALMNRSCWIPTEDILGTKREMFLWTNYMVRTNHILRQHEVSDEVMEEILSFMKDNINICRDLSIRMAVMLAGIYKIDPETWKESALEVITSHDGI